MNTSDTPPAEHQIDPDHLPTPFSAAQIREACAPGRSNRFRVTSGAATSVTVWEFFAGDDAGGWGRSWSEATDGTPGDDVSESYSTWEDLQGHASYPMDRTTVEPALLEIAAGAFECWLYQSSTDDGSLTRAWFARNLPGPPVLFEMVADGQVVNRSELIEFVDPR